MAASDQDWERRYREVVAEYDAKQAEWRRAEAELQRLLLRGLRALASDAAPARVDSESLVGLRRLAEEPESVDPSAVRPDVVRLAERVLTEISHEAPRQQARNAVDIDELRQLALEFVNTLSVPKDQRVRAMAYKRAIEQATTRSEVALAMLDCATWLSSIFQQLWMELGEATHYLDTLNHYLDQIEQFVNDTRDHQARAAQRDKALDEVARRDADDLLAATRDLADADSMVAALQHFCERLRQGLDEWRRASDRARAELDARVADLVEQLQAAHKEAQTLREAVASSEMRVRLDALTGLSNRVAFEERLGEELARLRRGLDSLSLMVLDIDHFKTINDTYGHLTGDNVLARLGAVFRQRLRASDFAARFGGEEFVILLPETRLDGAAQAAEVYRRAVEKLTFPLTDGPALSVTISIGVTEVTPEDTPESAFGRADAALYEAKRGGRNRVVVG